MPRPVWSLAMVCGAEGSFLAASSMSLGSCWAMKSGAVEAAMKDLRLEAAYWGWRASLPAPAEVEDGVLGDAIVEGGGGTSDGGEAEEGGEGPGGKCVQAIHRYSFSKWGDGCFNAKG